jgi:hypothetical protein
MRNLELQGFRTAVGPPASLIFAAWIVITFCLLMVLWPAILVVVENRGLQRLLE